MVVWYVQDMAPLKAGEKVEEALSVTDEEHFGKKGIIIMIDDNGRKYQQYSKTKKTQINTIETNHQIYKLF